MVSSPEHVNIDRNLFQGLTEIVAIAAKAFQHHSTHWMCDHRIGMTGQQVLILGEVIANGNDGLAALTEAFKCRNNFLRFTDSNIHQGIQLHHQGVDCRILGRIIDRLYDVPQQNFVIRRRRLAYQCLQRIDRGFLIHHGATHIQQQRRFFR